jgi:maltooligosyltrehalose trehalohydrolase
MMNGGADILSRNIGVSFRNGHAEVRLWAPLPEKVELCINGSIKIPLKKQHRGYWHLNTELLQPGDRYLFRLDGNEEFPDPASLLQPNGVHRASEAIEIENFEWTDAAWSNPPLDEYIFYELHTGLFSEEGDFEGIEHKLNYIKELGITAIELMPVAAFPGRRNWGYDGVYPFAVKQTYGAAGGLQKLVNHCHRIGLAVVLDVVYNHMGPEGNYLEYFGPYFTEKYKTPWGCAINFDDAGCDGVRNFFIENALMWLRDFHIDALRLDAVHAIRDFSPEHILCSLRKKVDELSALTGRTYYLIVECDLNDVRFITPIGEKGFGMHAQWADEFHHALRVAAGQERKGYYEDFNGVPDLAKAYKDAYVYDGEYSLHRNRIFGTKASENPGEQFVVFSQNHDQVGNRMLGERSSQLVSFEMLKVLAGAVILSPYLPLLFMGEEWGEPHPFLYFVHHGEADLIEAVRKGRKEEFRHFQKKGEVPDPQDRATFEKCLLQWQLTDKQPHATLLAYYKLLIRLRKAHLPLRLFKRGQTASGYNDSAQSVWLHRWHEEKHIYLFLNFSRQKQSIALPYTDASWHKLLCSADREWDGKATARETVPAGIPFLTQGESISVYCNYV